MPPVVVSPYNAWSLGLSPLASDASSLAHELFVPEVFAQDNLPEHLTRSELQRSISHLGDLERLHCFLDKVCGHGKPQSAATVPKHVPEAQGTCPEHHYTRCAYESQPQASAAGNGASQFTSGRP